MFNPGFVWMLVLGLAWSIAATIGFFIWLAGVQKERSLRIKLKTTAAVGATLQILLYLVLTGNERLPLTIYHHVAFVLFGSIAYFFARALLIRMARELGLSSTSDRS